MINMEGDEVIFGPRINFVLKAAEKSGVSGHHYCSVTLQG
jgi:hypothetical protein